MKKECFTTAKPVFFSYTMKDPGLNPAWDYDIDRLESEMACHYSNSRAPGGSYATYDIRKNIWVELRLQDPGVPDLPLSQAASLEIES